MAQQVFYIFKIKFFLDRFIDLDLSSVLGLQGDQAEFT